MASRASLTMQGVRLLRRAGGFASQHSEPNAVSFGVVSAFGTLTILLGAAAYFSFQYLLR